MYHNTHMEAKGRHKSLHPYYTGCRDHIQMVRFGKGTFICWAILQALFCVILTCIFLTIYKVSVTNRSPLYFLFCEQSVHVSPNFHRVFWFFCIELEEILLNQRKPLLIFFPFWDKVSRRPGSNSLCIWRWPWTSDPPASVSWLHTCTTTLSFCGTGGLGVEPRTSCMWG